ncbi:MAG: histidine kinase dimerization/phospho-acceptor domain-containing protein, partial [Sphingopyxis sp.]
MRFDDRLETVLRIDPTHAGGRNAMWCQLVDMLAQSGQSMSQPAVARGLAATAMLRDDVPLDMRVSTARAVAARCRFAPLAAMMAHDQPPVVVAFMDHVALDDGDWATTMADLGPLARSRLRQRADLPQTAHRALAAFGTIDFALGNDAQTGDAVYNGAISANELTPDPLPPAELAEALPGTAAAHETASDVAQPGPINVAAIPAGQSNIADLVKRIEAYRERNPDAGRNGTQTAQSTPAQVADKIAFRTDIEGYLRAIDGANRGAFIGLIIAQPAHSGESGFDAGVARAFNKRAPVRAGRLWLSGQGPSSGHWLVDADPQFDRLTGRFQGFVGQIRRSLGDIAEQVAVLADAGAPSRPLAEGMRQMVHELRSPLNAINGFAQLIEGQYFGPVPHHYRELAQSIMADSGKLAGAFDDIDTAARMDMGTIGVEPGQSDFAQAISSAIGDLIASTNPRDTDFAITGLNTPMLIGVPQHDASRIASRLLGAITQNCGAGDIVLGELASSPRTHRASLTMCLPERLLTTDLHAAMVDLDGSQSTNVDGGV